MKLEQRHARTRTHTSCLLTIFGASPSWFMTHDFTHTQTHRKSKAIAGSTQTQTQSRDRRSAAHTRNQTKQTIKQILYLNEKNIYVDHTLTPHTVTHKSSSGLEDRRYRDAKQ